MSAALHDHHSLDNQTTKVEHNNYDLEAGNGVNMAGGAPLGRQISVQLTNEQYERLFLNPGGQKSKGDAAKRFGNPTPLGIASFLLCLTPFSCELMGWAGTTTNAAATTVGAYYFIGGIGLYLSGLLEWIIGNTFPATVFMVFGAFWLAFGFLLQPTQGIAAALGASSVDYNAGIALYLVWWGLLVLIFLIASLRTNVVFVALFTFLDITFWLLVTLYLDIAQAKTAHLATLMKAAGATGFLTCICGWYLLVVLVFGSTGIPLALPVGDLSNFMSPRRKDA
ncbi:GPR1/FUN34/yaaH family-domain-containing protein [Leucosporidium creatinivorum]|uniref:GPR1/FUN34/yaaH family-domain-containing protein n=1 Tax=Leucosporidium creatinivorum TaxID=106004 RepID=A0A1Y2EMY1_9BASI|nr:GPR1/FUN34/yaaH family-domain-containing protein [Leucosporidium creatinivorum]